MGSEGESIDTKKVVGDTLDAMMKRLFGVSEWAEIKKKWAAASRIYSAGAQIVGSIREIGSSIQDTQ